MKKKSAFILLSACLACAGCTTAPQKGSSESLQNENSAQQPAAVVQLSDQQKASLFTFSWNLFNELYEDGKDALASPLSAYFALGMAAQGADGKTLDEIEKTLGTDVKTMRELSASAIQSAQGENRQLQIANSIWVKDTELDSSYLDVLKEDYDAEGFESAFDSKAADQINDWVSQKTDGQISKMVDSSEIESLSLLLLNAINFDAKWQTSYESEDITRFTFTAASGESQECDAMLSIEDQYVDAGSVHGFMRPYEGGRYALCGLIPKDEQKTIDEALQKIDSSGLEKAIQTPQQRDVHATMPPFEVESAFSLKDALQKLGMDLPFSDLADFSGMSKSTKLKIGAVNQKSRLLLNAQGTKAAAATDVGMVEESARVEEDPIYIACNRPFLYLIVDIETGTPVFIGIQNSIPTESAGLK